MMDRYVNGIDLESLYTVIDGKFKLNDGVRGSLSALAESYFYEKLKINDSSSTMNKD